MRTVAHNGFKPSNETVSRKPLPEPRCQIRVRIPASAGTEHTFEVMRLALEAQHRANRRVAAH